MRIAVYGAGGVGGYFGGRLAQAGAEVHFIARGAHLRALREHGLSVRSVKGDFEVRVPATDDPADVGQCDFVLFVLRPPCSGRAYVGGGVRHPQALGCPQPAGQQRLARCYQRV